jgi:MoaA/NifB/PqqE/SkfB family radical SAM enzyme/peptidoglycan/xylan/chitin deacetylase (PgdA/CDA1 family)
MKTPVAVVVTSWNVGQYLPEAIASIQAQTRPPAEVVLVDDGSDDPWTPSALRDAEMSGIHVVRAERMGSPTRSRNLGFSLTSSPLVMFLDADDRLEPEYIATLAGRLDERPDLDYVSCAMRHFGAASLVWTPPAPDTARSLTFGTVHASTVFRRQLFERVGGYDETLECWELHDFWMRAHCLGFKGEVLPEPLLAYRILPDSLYHRLEITDEYCATTRLVAEKIRSHLEPIAQKVLMVKEEFIEQQRNYQAEISLRLESLRRELQSLDAELDAEGGPPITVVQVQQEPIRRISPAIRQVRRLPRAKFERRAAGAVLCFHRVSDPREDSTNLAVAPAAFTALFEKLREQHPFFPLDELAQQAASGELPDGAFAVTFDDGYADALPAARWLAQHGIPATHFVCTMALGAECEFWWDVLARIFLSGLPLPPRLRLELDGTNIDCATVTADECVQAWWRMTETIHAATHEKRESVLAALAAWCGFDLAPRASHRAMNLNEVRQIAVLPGQTIGCHTHHHLLLPAQPLAVQREEIAGARRELERLLNRPVTMFSYPYGDHIPATVRLVEEAGFSAAVTVNPVEVRSGAYPLLLPRFEVTATNVADMVNILAPNAGRMIPRLPVPSMRENTALNNREHQDQKSVLNSRPQFLIIDPSSRCTARCVMCPQSFRQPGDLGTDLSLECFAQVEEVIPAAVHINLFSSGEPTLAPDLEFFIARTRQHADRQTQIWLGTNGKFLPPEILDLLFDHRMGLQFSVDGGSREVFESIRRGISFAELCATLEQVCRARGSRPFPRISFSCVMSKRNLHDLSAIFVLAAKYRVDQVIFYDEDPESLDEARQVLDESDRPIFEKQMLAITASGIKYCANLNWRGRRDASHFGQTIAQDGCSAPWKVFHLRANGDVFPCCTLRTPLGKLGPQTFEEVWNGEGYTRLRRAFIEKTELPAECYTCVDPLRQY